MLHFRGRGLLCTDLCAAMYACITQLADGAQPGQPWSLTWLQQSEEFRRLDVRVDVRRAMTRKQVRP